jgi:hypothetical protein
MSLCCPYAIQLLWTEDISTRQFRLEPRIHRCLLRFGAHDAIRTLASPLSFIFSIRKSTHFKMDRSEKLHPGEIRLVELFPGQSANGVRCELHSGSLNDGPIYEALSYTWGSNEKDHAVTIGNAELGITANLQNAFHHLRLGDSPRLIWIDAICVN